jgi:hypothetical protein
MRAALAAIAIVASIGLSGTACSSDGGVSCADLAARIAELEATPAVTDPSWNSVESMAQRSIERDSLRAKQVQKHCR